MILLFGVLYPIIGQLESHLDEGIRTDAAFLHEALAESRMSQ